MYARYDYYSLIWTETPPRGQNENPRTQSERKADPIFPGKTNSTTTSGVGRCMIIIICREFSRENQTEMLSDIDAYVGLGSCDKIVRQLPRLRLIMNFRRDAIAANGMCTDYDIILGTKNNVNGRFEFYDHCKNLVNILEKIMNFSIFSCTYCTNV